MESLDLMMYDFDIENANNDTDFNMTGGPVSIFLTPT